MTPAGRMALASKESASPPVPTHAKIGTIARIEALDFTDARCPLSKARCGVRVGAGRGPAAARREKGRH